MNTNRISIFLLNTLSQICTVEWDLQAQCDSQGSSNGRAAGGGREPSHWLGANHYSEKPTADWVKIRQGFYLHSRL